MARKFWVHTNRNTEITAAVTNIAHYSDAVQREIKKSIQESTKAVFDGAIKRVPVRTGELQRSMKMRFGRDQLSGFVSANAPYDHLVEFGAHAAYIEPKKKKALKFNGCYASHVFIKARKAHPFLRPSADDEKGKLEKRITEAIEHGRH